MNSDDEQHISAIDHSESKSLSANDQDDRAQDGNLVDGLAEVSAARLANAAPSLAALSLRRFVALLIDSMLVGAISAAVIAIPVFNGIDFAAETPLAVFFRLLLICSASFIVGFIDSAFAFGWLLFPFCILTGFAPSLPVVQCWSICVLPLFVNHIYHAVYEGSAKQATPGKRFMGLFMCGAQGQRLLPQSFMLRHCLKFFTVVLSCLPLVHMASCKRSQLLHDVFVGSFVVPKECPLVVDLREGQLRPDKSQVASVKRRIVASMLDSVAFCAIMQIVLTPVVLIPTRLFARLDMSNAFLVMAIVCLLLPAIASLLTVLIYAAIESSALQATPGKIVAGLKVTGHNGQRITLAQSIVKQFNQCLAYLSLYPILGLVALLSKVLPTAESAISIIGVCVFYLAYGAMLCISFKSGQTLLDRVCERYVLLDSPAASHAFETPSDTVRLTEKWRLES